MNRSRESGDFGEKLRKMEHANLSSKLTVEINIINLNIMSNIVQPSYDVLMNFFV